MSTPSKLPSFWLDPDAHFDAALKRLERHYPPVMHTSYKPILYCDALDSDFEAEADTVPLRRLCGNEGVVVMDDSQPDQDLDRIAKEHDYFWPHRGGCPVCGSDAYVGFASVECSNGSCVNFVR